MTAPQARPIILAAAYGTDWLIGDPEHLPHPVRLIGHAITQGEHLLYRSDRGRQNQFLAGATLTATIVTGTYYLTRGMLALAYRISPPLGTLTEIALASTCLASRNLHDEASAVLRALASDNISLARTRLARIVGRDTHALDTTGISRAVIETLAESACDGVFAPIFYLALGGVPLAMAYKAVSTLDSMIGYTTPRYLYFGKAAARLDDAANYLPARLTAAVLTTCAAVLPGTSAPHATRTWLRDGHLHASPNAGQPESAIAGALRVQLGGPSTYNGEPHHAPIMGAEFLPPTPIHAKNALRLVAMLSAVSILAAIALTRRSAQRSTRAATR